MEKRQSGICQNCHQEKLLCGFHLCRVCYDKLYHAEHRTLDMGLATKKSVERWLKIHSPSTRVVVRKKRLVLLFNGFRPDHENEYTCAEEWLHRMN